jgi:uncharacterized membrane protein YgcG
MSMRRSRVLAPAVLAGWLASAGVASAVFPPPVKDEGKFFSAEGLEKANKKIRQIYEGSGCDVVVETVPAVPADLEAKFKELGRDKFFLEWAEKRTKELGVNGVYVLICKSPGRIEVGLTGPASRRLFGAGDRREITNKLLGPFREKKFDEGLTAALDFIEARVKKGGAR